MEKTSFLKNISFLLSFLAFVFAIVALPVNLELAAVSINPYFFNQLDITQIHPISNLYYNTFHSWSFTPAISNYLNFTNSDLHVVIVLFFHLLFFISGIFSLLCYFLPKERLPVLFITINFTITFFILFKHDLVLLSSLSFLPLYIYCFLKLSGSNGGRLFALFLLLPALYLFLTSANQLSIIYCLLPLLYFSWTSSKPWLKALFLISCCLCIVRFSLYPAAEFPDYPTTARVVAEDTVPGNSRPVIGPDSVIQFQNLVIQREAFYWCSVVLAVFALLNFYSNRSSRSALIILTISVCLLLDCLLPDYLAHILPLETLGRIVPHLFFFSLIAVSAALLLILLTCEFVRTRRVYLINLMFLAIIIFSNSGKNFDYLHSQNINNLKKIFAFNYDPNFFQNSQIFKIINSPSAAVLMNYGSSEITKIFPFTKLQFKSIAALQPQFITTHKNIDSLKAHLADYDDEVRWTSGDGQQRGNEKIYIKLTIPAWFTALELATGPASFAGYFTDFPRGLRVSSSPDCNFNEENLVLLADYPVWAGSVKYTPGYFPYFSHESLVKIYLPKPEKLECILIEQTGITNKSDWSITEIKGLYSPTPARLKAKALAS